MKVAVVSDIHGNHYALKEVLIQAREKGVETLLVLGDIVGYYYHPELVLDLLEEWNYEMIKGNHEEILEGIYNKSIGSERIEEKYGKGHKYALENLDNNRLKKLFNLPIRKTVKIGEVLFQLNHGSPWKIDDYLYPDSDITKLNNCDSKEHDFVLIGHSHYQFSFECSNSILINPGSVGQSRQKGGVAYWCMVDTSNKRYYLESVAYDTSDLIDELRDNGNNNSYVVKVLKR